MAVISDSDILAELSDIKKLMIYALLNKNKQEHTQSDIAAALGTSQSKISRMVGRSSGKEQRGQ